MCLFQFKTKQAHLCLFKPQPNSNFDSNWSQSLRALFEWYVTGKPVVGTTTCPESHPPQRWAVEKQPIYNNVTPVDEFTKGKQSPPECAHPFKDWQTKLYTRAHVGNRLWLESRAGKWTRTAGLSSHGRHKENRVGNSRWQWLSKILRLLPSCLAWNSEQHWSYDPCGFFNGFHCSPLGEKLTKKGR